MDDDKLKWTRPRILDLDDKDAPWASGGECLFGNTDVDCASGNSPIEFCNTGSTISSPGSVGAPRP